MVSRVAARARREHEVKSAYARSHPLAPPWSEQAGKDYENSSLCQLCWEGGDMICCDFCPNVMHSACAGIDDPSTLGNMWSCPHHKCVTCGRKAYAAGGLLFRCSECPKAYCEDHLPQQSELIGGEVDRLLALGFQVSSE